jgi:hypothetical protein
MKQPKVYQHKGVTYTLERDENGLWCLYRQGFLLDRDKYQNDLIERITQGKYSRSVSQ